MSSNVSRLRSIRPFVRWTMSFRHYPKPYPVDKLEKDIISPILMEKKQSLSTTTSKFSKMPSASPQSHRWMMIQYQPSRLAHHHPQSHLLTQTL